MEENVWDCPERISAKYSTGALQKNDQHFPLKCFHAVGPGERLLEDRS
jgi:hypothetical protein